MQSCSFMFDWLFRRITLVLIPLVVVSSLAAGASAESPIQIEDVRFEGARYVSIDALRAQIPKTAGSVSRDEMSGYVKTLYSTGFFDQVSAKLVQEDRRQLLVFSVVEKPMVRKLYVKGNDNLDESDIAEIVIFEGRRFLDRSKLDAQIRRVVSTYQGRGFYDASVEYAVTPVGDGQVDLTLNVTEGQRYKIKRIDVRGLKELDEDDILETIQTKDYRWWSSWLFGTGRVNQEMLENDKGLIRQYLLDQGFIDGSVSDPMVEKHEDNRLVVIFEVDEGQRYSISELTASGDLIDGSIETTLEGIRSAVGETFSATKIREDSFTISDKFTDRGYAFANVVPDTRINRAEHAVSIDFRTVQGKEVQVNRINIRGNDKSYDNVIRRTLTINEQEKYSSSKIKRSQTLLQRQGFYEEVNISTQPTDRDDQVDLDVTVREAATGSFSAGAGFSSSDGALFNARLAENNLWGTGRRAVFNVDIGTERDNISISLTDDRLYDSFWSLGGELYKTDREFSDFDREIAGAAMTLGYPLEQIGPEWLEDVSFSLRYAYEEVDITDVDEEDAADFVIDSEGSTTVSGITPRLTRSTINNPLNPTSGSRQSLGIEIAGLGAEAEYYLIDARNQWYYPLAKGDWGELTFSWRTSFGYGEGSGGDPLPLFRRFFPGGINSVRGFESRTLGPKDEDGNEYGGSKELVNNVEVIFPLINSAGLRGVAFYDVGEAFDDDKSIDIGELRQAYGFGIRWTSPLGPIRVEFGFPIDREEGEDSPVTLFAFGAPF
ncbi:MAG: outer membrane protein assembly factor BamA [Bdellovibrionota bacterium]|nr:MAG: outer membrane protein assembly factor BamA [Bdellovibrionota bacterium]